ncbi:hypothetical protein [Microcoleus sp.]|uniref:hypothetical protein n=1 Tax=Microcoleus sp. TaxID=44472 RepID=UPI0035257DC2
MNNSDVTGFDITPPSPPQGGKFRNQEEVTPPSPPQGGKFRNQEEVTPPSPPQGGKFRNQEEGKCNQIDGFSN